jgi:ammonia channel protein AmtB
MFSRLCTKYLDIMVVLNATLAGGAAMGAAGELINYPFCSMIVGFVAGMVACLGYAYINGFLKNYLRLHDTRGVLYGHGLAGIIGGITSVISCALAEKNFGNRYNEYFYSES